MTMSSAVSKATLNGDGVQTEFPFAFKVWKAGDLEVSITSPAGANTVVTEWTADLVGNGGTVTYPTVGDPLPLGWKITIRRFMDFLQDVDLVSGTRFDPEVIETALDIATAERQQLLEEISRAVRVGVASEEDPANVVNQVFAARDAAVSAALVAEASANLVGPLLGTEGSSLVGFMQDGTGAGARTVQDKLRDVVSVKDFGAVGDGVTDDTDAIQAAVAQCKAAGKKLDVPGGVYILAETVTIDDEIVIEGQDSSFDCIFRFIGTGTKVVRTQVLHPTDGTDPAISVGLLVAGAGVQIKNILVDLDCDYTNTSSSNLGANWDVGILVQKPAAKLEKVRVRGYWREAGVWVDNTASNGNCDGITCEDVRFQGKWGLKIKGPNLKSGTTSIDNSTDSRGSGGISDFLASNFYFESYNHHSGVRTSDTDGGCLWIDGAVDPGTAATDAIQGHRFVAGRMYTFDPFAVKIEKSIRDLFVGCFIERITGKFKTDGVTPAGDADVQVYSMPVGSTGGTKALRLLGTDIYRLTNNFSRTNGFYLEQQLNQGMVQTTSRAEGVHEYPNGVRLGAETGNTVLDYYNEGILTPSLDFVTVTYTSRTGVYSRIGNLVFAQIFLNVETLDTADVSQFTLTALPFPPTSGQPVSVTVDYGRSTLLNARINLSHSPSSLARLIAVSDLGEARNYNSGDFKMSGTLSIGITYRIA